MYTCVNCDKTFTRRDNLLRHKKHSCIPLLNNGEPLPKQRRVEPEPSTSHAGLETRNQMNLNMFTCVNCHKTFTTTSNLRRHENQSCSRVVNDDGPAVVSTPKIDRPSSKRPRGVPTPSTSHVSMETCNCCSVTVPANRMAAHKRTLQHRTNSCVSVSDGVDQIQSAFKGRIISYRVYSTKDGYMDYKVFFAAIKDKVTKLIEEVIELHLSTKINMEVFARYVLQTQDLTDIKSFNTSNKVVDQSMDLDAIYDTFADVMIAKTSEFQERDSGWALAKIEYVDVNINKYSPMCGSSYIKLPSFIERKRAVVNIRNRDDCCFAWAVTSALVQPVGRETETSSYPHYSSVLNVAGMNFPVKLKDISKFEKTNRISINVYGLESVFKHNKREYEIVGPLRYSDMKMHIHINLLLLTDDEGNNHYTWIRDLSRLVSKQISANDHKKYFCDGCLIYFSKEEFLRKHQENDCNFIYTKIPSTNIRIDKFGNSVPENILKFENFERQLKVPFVVYADFESMLKPLQTCEPNPKSSYTNKTFVHEAYSFAYLIKCSFDDSLSKFVLYRGEDAAEVFIARLEADLKDIYQKSLKNIVPMIPLTPAEEIEFNNATICGICNEYFKEDSVKVRDHCHLTGKKRYGAAHATCNLNYKLPNYVPIILHNMSGYDIHMFIKQLVSYGDRIDVLAQSKEKYISLTKHILVDEYVDKKGQSRNKYSQMRFIDSFKFMASSLQTLGENLLPDQFFETLKHFPDRQKFQFMQQKGIFPYSFVDNFEKLLHEHLPTKNQFYDNLNEEHISDEDYERAKMVWELFKCKNLGEYSDVYLKSDVLLLCDIFESFRNSCIDKYKLDPAHYYTSPGLSWDAMLKYTGVNLELLVDIDMIHFFKKGIRGGISQCSERKHVANNKFIPNYNPNEKSSFISYLDATNLYGHSMSQPLPTGGFEWLSDEDIADLNIMNIGDESSQGYVLEVDMHYPQHLHDLHSDFPFLAENFCSPGSKYEKLTPNVNDKKKYVVHYRTLKQAIKNGLVLTKIHRAIKFNQSPWLKKYIDLNTELRNNATSKFERDLYKLIINSVFGKCLENVDNRTDIRLISHWENIRKKIGAGTLIARPNFKTVTMFNEHFVAIHLGKVRVNYCKPSYVGFSILDLSKTVIYDFYYELMKKKYEDNVSLMYTDTDSLVVRIETEDFYQFMSDNIEHFDTSNYTEGNIFNIPITKSALGKMKDEFPADPVISFYGTGAKAYYVQSLNNELKKAKGVKRSVVKKQLTMSDYQKIVENGGHIFRKMNTFRSDLHDMYTEMKNKVALSYRDDKRFIIPNTTKTLPWGHSDILFYQTDPNENFNLLTAAIGTLDDNVQNDIITQLAPSTSSVGNELSETENIDLLISAMLYELNN